MLDVGGWIRRNSALPNSYPNF